MPINKTNTSSSSDSLVYEKKCGAAFRDRPTLGFLLPYLDSIEGIEWLGAVDAARTHDVNLICFAGERLRDPDGFKEQANILYDLVSAERLDGIIGGIAAITPLVEQHESRKFWEPFLAVPFINFDSAIEGIPSVLMDNYQGMRELLIHLIEEHGYRRIAFIRDSPHNQGLQERYRAYVDTLAEYGIPFNLDLVTPPGPWHEGVERFKLLLDERKLIPHQDFEVVVGASDPMIVGASEPMIVRGVLDELHERGIDIPVVGFSDNIESQSSTPPITTVRVPIYEMGHKTVEMVLALLNGETVSEQEILAPILIIRQSCGCMEPTVMKIPASPVMSGNNSLQPLMSEHREIILAEMAQTLGASDKEMKDWIEPIFDAFMRDMRDGSPASFLLALDAVLEQFIAHDGNVEQWQNAISAMRQRIIPLIASRTLLIQAENFWQQARVIIGQAVRRDHERQSLQTAQQSRILHEISARLINIFDVMELLDVLAEELPRLGIPSCYLSLYEDAELYRYPDSVPEWSRLMLAYNEHGRLQVEANGRRFPSRQLVPEEFLPSTRSYVMVAEPIYFREQQLGFILFEFGPLEGSLYRFLRGEISSTIQSALLAQRVREHAAEIARQKYVLDTFMETVPDSIYFKDREGRITQTNKAHALSLGLHDPVEVIGKTDFDFFPAEQARIKFEQEQKIISSGMPLPTVEELNAHGNWVLTTKMPLRDEHGAIIGTFGISRDITELKRYREHLEDLVEKRTVEISQINANLYEEIVERKKVEQALQLSEQQYRSLAENVKDGIVIVQHGAVVFANAAFAAMTGQTVDLLHEKEFISLFPSHVKDVVLDRLATIPPEHWTIPWQIELFSVNDQLIWTEIEQSVIRWNSQTALLLTVRNIHQSKLRELFLERERAQLRQENLSFKTAITERYRFGQLVGKSAAMQRVYELIVSAAASGVNVLIVGESGTGKELIARSIHQISPRKDRPFVSVNCASIPETLFEREFFGHRKGTFTGADRDKPGFFDQAHQGVLFLDEVTELTPGAQAKLLRVLQDGEYFPLGSTLPKQANVVVVAATNKNCQEEIAAGRLRQDFFYRICVIRIDVPPLHKRKEDLTLLIEHLLEEYLQTQENLPQNNWNPLPVSLTEMPNELVNALFAYDWPGNVRELQNVLQHYLATGDLSSVLSRVGVSEGIRGISRHPERSENSPTLREAINNLERQMIIKTLAETSNNRRKTARILGITRRTLYLKLAKYGLLKSEEQKNKYE